MLDATRTFLSLVRWLGPWSGDGDVPADVRHSEVAVEGVRGPFPLRRYAPTRRRPVGTYLVAPGLHYAGPDDPRLDRFCRILATAGFAVACPFLPDYVALRVAPSAVEDFERCFDAEREVARAPGRIALFSISFGSLVALRLAAARGNEVDSLICFGGYADWDETVRFCLTGEVDGRVLGPHDPLNQPVVLANLIEDVVAIHGGPADPEALLAGWRTYVEATWGREEMKAPGRYTEVANRMMAGLPENCHELFLVGVGVRPGALELCTRALERAGDRYAFLDPRPHLATVTCPVHVVHGVDDDVIPYGHAELLRRALPERVRPRVHLTGLYGHSRVAQTRSPLAALREIATMIAIVRAMAAPARHR